MKVRGISYNLIVFFVAIIFLATYQISLSKDKEENSKRVLTVYTNSSFAGDWAEEGHPIKLIFEEKCNCKLDLVSLDSGGTLLSRLLLEGSNSRADLVMGLDTNLQVQAQETGLFVPYKVDTSNLLLPIKWDNKYFLPYDYGYFSFIYDERKLLDPPKSFEELINDNKIRIIIQDPRSSTAGLGLLAWVKSIYKDKSPNIWKKLFPKIVTVTKSWAESYALFLKGEADMVLSYNTSPAYHMIAEKRYNYKAAEFKEGHYLQIELIGKLFNAPNPELADMFLEFVLSPNFQAQILRNNFMNSVIDVGKDMPYEYNHISKPKIVLYTNPEEIRKNKNDWIQEWLNSTSKN